MSRTSTFELPEYRAPDFSEDRFRTAAEARFVPAERDGIAPENYHATTIFPEYFRVGDLWLLAEKSRMDCVAVLSAGEIRAVEFRNLKAGDRVAVGRSEDGSEGIYVHTGGFDRREESSQAFSFRASRTRETAFSRDYDRLYDLLRHERAHGNIAWVMGPACAFDHDARDAFAALVKAGYVSSLMAGNALATHDLEAGSRGTALGQDIYTQESRPNGHYNHIDTINDVCRCGSIPAFLRLHPQTGGIIASCVEEKVPFVLVGSIRDDGPLPEVIHDVYAGQSAMRALLERATTVVCMATTLHTIAAGNMTPSYCVRDGRVRPVYFYTVDISEFSVNKLRDRGSLSAVSIVANAQDFVVNCSRALRAPDRA